MSLTYSLHLLPTEPLVLILSHLIPSDLAHLRLTCSVLQAQLDHLGASKSIVKQQYVSPSQCTLHIRQWPQLSMERLDMVTRAYDLHRVVTNYAGESCMVASIVDETTYRYLYINNGMAKHMLGVYVSNRLDIWILRSVEPLGVQEYITEWMNYKYHGSIRLTGMVGFPFPSIRRAVLDIWDTHWGGCQHIFAPEVVHLLTSW